MLIKRWLLVLSVSFVLSALFCVARPAEQIEAVSTKLIGTNSNGVGNHGANHVGYTRFVCSSSGTVNEIRVYSAVAGDVKFAIYANNAGVPGDKITGDDNPHAVSVGWNTFSFPSTEVVGDTVYWIGQINDTTGATTWVSDANGLCLYKSATFSTFSWPSSAGTGFTDAGAYDYCLAGYGESAVDYSVNVGSSSTPWSQGWAGQRYDFYAQGLYWVFYADGSNMVYRTSSDGTTWSSAVVVRSNASNGGYTSSFAFDGIYFHYAYTTTTFGGDMYYRMGLANSDGTITWQANEQLAWDIDGSHVLTDPTIAIDSNGYPWIATAYENGHGGVAYGYVLKSSTKNGIWTNEATLFMSPYQFSTSAYQCSSASCPSAWCAIATLTDGKTYALIYGDGDKAYGSTEKNITGRLWDGSTWGSQETCVVEEHVSQDSLSYVAVGNNVHIVYGVNTTHTNWPHDNDNTYYAERIYGIGWSTPTVVRERSVSDFTTASLSKDSSGDLYCFWEDEPNTSHVYYKRCVDGVWDLDPTDWFTSSELITEHGWHSISSDSICNGNILFTFSTGNSPYNVHLALLPVEDHYPPIILNVSTKAIDQRTVDFGGVKIGSVSESYEYNIVNNEEEPFAFMITSNTEFYNDCLQISDDNENWEYVGDGWETPVIEPSGSYDVWFRVNVPAGASSATYMGNILFSVSQ